MTPVFGPGSSITDENILPEKHGKICLYKYGKEKLVGFHIWDGSIFRVIPHKL
jgi:partitioning defective protein 6